MSRFLLFLTSLAVVALDRMTKLYVQSVVTPYEAIPVIPGLFRIVHTENAGAAFGILAEGNAVVRVLVLVGVSFVVMYFVGAALWRGDSVRTIHGQLGLACILGGAVGNFYDRILRGTVTDFLEFYRGGWSFPAFNVADSAITLGAVLLIIEYFRGRVPRQQSSSVIK